jgi:hypothetical protein
MTLVKWYGAKASEGAKRGAARGRRLGAEHVLEEANRVVPIEEATLLRSGVASVDEGGLRGAVSFDTPYLGGSPARRTDLAARRGQKREVSGDTPSVGAKRSPGSDSTRDQSGARMRACTMDHVIPLSKGGPHIEENIRPAHAVCNLRKGARL